ncbi:MAG: DUF4159 domain-containing protein [Alphaproteobacteria bacterium]
MLELGAIAFAAPWALVGLGVLPLLWWLLRLIPPTPRLVRFPPIRLLLGLKPSEETPARTPPWLIALRLLLAGLIVLALARPLLNPAAPFAGTGPVILVVDDGWAAARRWDARRTAFDRFLDQAAREGRAVAVITTAPTGAHPEPGGLMRPAEVRTLVQRLAPKPWPVDRAAALAAVEALSFEGSADVVWFSDGLGDGTEHSFAARLQRLGRLRVLVGPRDDLPAAVLPPVDRGRGLRLRLIRADDRTRREAWVRATAEDGRTLARVPAAFQAGERETQATLELPVEVRNRIERLEIEGGGSAAGVVLLDERWRRRPVGLVSGGPIDRDQPLLSELYYLERALAPYTEVRSGRLSVLLERPPAVIVLADVGKVPTPARDALDEWLEAGGVLVRFAGLRVAEGVDDLVPVRLRSGGRILGGALSWTRPARLAPFEKTSPFAGLTVPRDVLIARQILAEPTLDLAAKTWVRLVDGTPLVTAERKGKGWLLLFHTTANTTWSNLSLSGLFVDMLRRLVALSEGVSGEGTEVLAPWKTLDAFGRLGDPPSATEPLEAALLSEARVEPSHPPGFYGTATSRRALNLSAGLTALDPLSELPAGVEVAAYGEGEAVDLGPWLLAAAVVLMLVDLMVSYRLRGLLSLAPRGLAVLTAAALSATLPAAAQAEDAFALTATLEMRLAYMRTGDAQVDRVSRAGLEGLTAILTARTSVEPAPPIAVDVERDELIFFPLIYWPITPAQPPLSDEALAKVDQYLKTGGIIVLDTRDQNPALGISLGTPSPGAERLRAILGRLNLPPLIPVPPDHVLTRAFYLIEHFPGRWTGGRVWVERHEGGINDGVSSIVIGGHDWAAAWALDSVSRPLFPVVPGGERQREIAFRFGINLVMYALTGNYKADAVHLPIILERLGQPMRGGT